MSHAHEQHFERLTHLLDVETRAQQQRGLDRAHRLSPAAAERTGDTLVDLIVVDEEPGLGGRVLVTLAKRHRGPLPWTRLDAGKPLIVSEQGSRTVAGHAVVASREEKQLVVAFDQLPDVLADAELLRIDLADDLAAARRQQAALDRASEASGNRLAKLRDVLMGTRPIDLHNRQPDTTVLDGFNEVQSQAIRMALTARDFALIHGPPGTGKTTTLVEVMRRAVARGERVLACAPSNMGVDNMLERLLAARVKAVRLGHPARVMPALRAATLDVLVEEQHEVRLAHKLAKEALTLFRKAGRYTRAKPAPGQKQAIRQQAKSLLADSRRLERAAVSFLLDSAEVLCATATGLDAGLIGDRTFDLVVIDEACQSTEPGCWIPICRAQRVVLAGDHCQLPPTVISPDAEREGFGVSLFERLVPIARDKVLCRLETQYRMHEKIMEFSSQEFYQGSQHAHPSVAAHLLADLPGVTPTPLTLEPLEFVDTCGANYDEALEPEGESKFNPKEAELIVAKVRALLDAQVPAGAIAVISPYAAQVRLLRQRLAELGVEVDTVDGFQGREKEAILISLVRSNEQHEIGFLADVRRTNVAMTRARRKLIVVGDSATLGSHPFYARWLEHFEAAGAYHSVWEETI